jgi:S-adenosylmethionine hydrolase
MKGVVLSICPEAVLVDLSHEIPRHDVSAAAYVLNRCRKYFPPRTIHLVVVDPGVGGARRPLVGVAHGQYLVGPDNGLFADFHDSDPTSQCFEITSGEYLLAPPSLSPTFQGRDVFAPAAAHLARGVPASAFGRRVYDPARIHTSGTSSGLAGAVVWVDRFGNLISDLHPEGSVQHMVVSVMGRELPIVACYEQAPQGLPAALVNSDQVVEIFVNRGDAAESLGAAIGTPITLVAPPKR